MKCVVAKSWEEVARLLKEADMVAVADLGTSTRIYCLSKNVHTIHGLLKGLFSDREVEIDRSSNTLITVLNIPGNLSIVVPTIKFATEK